MGCRKGQTHGCCSVPSGSGFSFATIPSMVIHWGTEALSVCHLRRPAHARTFALRWDGMGGILCPPMIHHELIWIVCSNNLPDKGPTQPLGMKLPRQIFRPK